MSEQRKPRIERGDNIGAGGGNRTRDSCLEGKGITIMQRPHNTAVWLIFELFGAFSFF